ncbi:MAG: peptidylprolyl isomerase [Candidatus Omnitrophica bacterium]|nr:peptidylprolyl isomerase [Candidatus Omnitrophota bacterium]
MNKIIYTILVFFVMIFCSITGLEAREDLSISKNRIVIIEYTLFIDGNKVIETTKGKGPLTYVQGKGQLLEFLENQLSGMRKGQKTTVMINPEDAYGEIRKDFIIKFPLEKLPEAAGVEGEILTVTGSDGKLVKCIVKEIKGKNAVLDFNHPLAGKILMYKVEIMDVKDVRQLG